MFVTFARPRTSSDRRKARMVLTMAASAPNCCELVKGGAGLIEGALSIEQRRVLSKFPAPAACLR